MKARGEYAELDGLILRKLDGSITPAEYQTLVALLERDRAAAEYYVEFALLYAGLSEPGKIVFSVDDETLDRGLYTSLFMQLAEEEKRASARPGGRQVEKQPELIKGVRELKKNLKSRRDISRFHVWFTLGSVAAVFLLMLFVVSNPRSVQMDVATLTDSVGAIWGRSEAQPKGARFKNNRPPVYLASGVATFQFDYGAEVVVEGPAEFSFVSAERMTLHSGRLFARVPTRAVGFTVDIPGGSIIDLGTEFGVIARPTGGDVKLFSGSATLLSGEQGTRCSSRLLQPGAARRVAAESGRVWSIELSSDAFVRRIDSASGIVWKGQPLDLADMVGGGNGLGTGQLETAIHPDTGHRGRYLSQDRSVENRYVQTPHERYIDGVFVPNGKTPQPVSSKGHLFKACPETAGLYYSEIINGAGRYLSDFVIDGVPVGRLGQTVYGTRENPALFIHANLGITFDLDAIRRDFPDFAESRFTAEAGVSTAAPRSPNADVWVLVDGQVRFCQRHISDKGKGFPIDIELKPTDRFLTLVTTDGGDPDGKRGGFRAIDSDWCVFVHPKLVLR